MLETYQETLIELGEKARSAAAFNRIVIEAAARAGFASDVPEDLLGMPPYEIKRLSERIIEHVNEATRPPSEGES